jgi:alanine dehydrogenase
MADLLILTREDVERLLDFDALLDGVRQALIELSAGRTSVPPRNAAFTDDGLLGAMPGYLPGAGLAVKLVTVFDKNEDRGLPSHQAVIMLFDPSSGVPLALMDGTHITAVRTAAAAAVAAKVLARQDTRVLAIVGSGVQAGTHLDAFARGFSPAEIRVAARDRSRAEALASRSPSAVVVDTFEAAARDADIVCCCTNADLPIIRHEWLKPGAHVSSVGRGAEVDPETVDAADVFVEWLGAVTSPVPAGAAELQGLDPSRVTEVGAVLSGASPGRTSPEQLTLYKSTGHAVEDAVAAGLVYRQAVAQGIGQRVEL